LCQSPAICIIAGKWLATSPIKVAGLSEYDEKQPFAIDPKVLRG